MQVVNNTFKWSRNLSVDFVKMLDYASKVNCVYRSFSLRKIRCLFVWPLSSRIIPIWAQYESCYYNKKTSQVRIIKKTITAWKRNLQMSLWVEWGNVIHDSLLHIFSSHVQEESWKQIKLLTQNIGWFLYKPKKPIRIWLNHRWANQRKLIEVDFVKVLGKFKLDWR